VISRIGDINIPICIHNDSGWKPELSPALAGFAPYGKKFSLRVELLDAVVAAIGYIYKTIPGNRHARR